MTKNQVEILLVDDDEDDYLIARELLSEVETMRFKVDWASTYDQAIEKINKTQFNVYLLDYRLDKGHSGLELVKALRNKGVNRPIIILTGQDDQEIDFEALKAGASDYLVKSQLSPQLLSRSIRYGIENQKTLERLKRDQKLFMGGPVTVFKCTAKDNWPVEYVSSNVMQFGYHPNEFISGTIDFMDIIDPHDKELLKKKVATTNRSTLSSFEIDYKIVKKDGEVRWVYNFISIIKDKTKKITHLDGYILDITERKKSEQAFKESEEKYRMLIENIQDGVFIIQKEIITFANEAFASFVGYKPDKMIGLDFKQLVAPEDHEKVLTNYDNRVKGKYAPSEYEFNMLSKDKKTRVIVNMSVGLIYYQGKLSSIGTVKNITEKKKADEELRLAANVFENTTEGIMVTDIDGYIESINPAFTTITGYEAEEAIGKKPSLLSSGKHNKEFYKLMWKVLRSENQWQGEIWNRRKNGQIFPEWLSINAIKDENNNLVNFVGVFSDITRIKLSEERLNYLAYHDPLTGLANRLLFRDRLKLAISSAHRNNKKVAILFFDLDSFKIINDTLGHSIGDLMLQGVAKRLLNCVRGSDTVARLGGDEFTIILPELEDIQSVSKVAQKILLLLSDEFLIEEHQLYISSSIGISVYPLDGENPDELISNADAAMYYVKGKGKNDYHYYTNELTKISFERLEFETNLHRALNNDEFTLLYQPIVDLSNGAIIGIEALVYWQTIDRLIPPNDFIPLAEENGLIVPIGKWVLETACFQNKKWQDQGFKYIPVTINLSARQFLQKDIVNSIDTVLSTSKLDPIYLEVDLTESAVMHDTDATVNILNSLKKRGIKISIDDFGTGHSSFSYLKRFPIDKLKIHESFVKDIINNEDDAAIVKALISMSKNLNLKVIAEGVEDIKQLQFLIKNKCDRAQGFYFSPPMTVQALTKLLKTKKAFNVK